MRTLTAVLITMMATSTGAQDAMVGLDLYNRHCATCHGAAADGNGPMAPALVVQPTNLTTLAARNDGVFPLLRAVMRIDGRDPLVAHGSSMPVFGELFEEEVQEVPLRTEAGQPVMMPQPVADLVVFLQGIQE